MALPILVPQPHELPLLGRYMRPAPTLRRFRWRLWARLPAEHRASSLARHDRFTEPTSQAIRDTLLAHWQLRCASRTPPPPAAPIAWCPRTSSDPRSLLHEAESALKSQLRRRCRELGEPSRPLRASAKSFNAHRWQLKVGPHQHEALVLMLCTMYWRGCQHPAALDSAPLHPPTALVRWLSRFAVQPQVDHGRQILHALVEEEIRVHAFASELVRRMLAQRGSLPRWVALVPELLKGVEPL